MPVAADQRGFSLVELVMTIVVLSVGLAGVILAVNTSTSHSSDAMIQIRAVELGQAYLDEILPKRFDENSAEGGTPRCGSSDTGSIACNGIGVEGEARANFDDVDDYHGLVDNPPENAEGVDRPGYVGYSVAVSVSFDGAALGGIPDEDAKRIDVTITTPQADSFVFSAYRTNF